MNNDHNANCPHCGGAPDPSNIPEQYVYAKLRASMWRNTYGGVALALITSIVLAFRYGAGAAVLALGVSLGSVMLGRWMAWGEQRSCDLVSVILVKRPELVREMFSDPDLRTFIVATQCMLIQDRINADRHKTL